MTVGARRSSWAIAGVALVTLAACTSPQDTRVDRPPATAAPSPPDTDTAADGSSLGTVPDTAPDTTPSPTGTAAPSASLPDAAPATQPPATGPPVTEPPPADATVPDDATPETAPPTETSEPVEQSVPTSGDDPDEVPADDGNETSLLAAIIGLLGFSVLLVFAARWMIDQDAREDGHAPHPDDDLPSDQMSL